MQIPSSWQENIYGSLLTSMKVGGMVRYFLRSDNISEIKDGIELANKLEIPVKIIGGGSNLLIADEGFSGLLIQSQFRECSLLSSERYLEELAIWANSKSVTARYKSESGSNLLNLNVTSEIASKKIQLVSFGAGLSWGQAVIWSLKQQLVGLEWFARIPCQVGGALFNNIHGEKHFFSEVVVAVHTLNLFTLEEQVWNNQQLDFAYDYCALHQENVLITSVVCALNLVDEVQAEAAMQQYLNWTKEKARVQPSGPNCGSVFKNIEPALALAKGYEAAAAAWYIDQAGLKGYEIGGMQVYPGHANFIINKGFGTTTDFIRLVEYIRSEVMQRFGIELEPEAECINSFGEKILWPKSYIES